MAEYSSDPGAIRAHTLASDLRTVLGTIIRRLREQSNPGDLSWSQKSVLRRLETEGPTTVSALARAEGVRPQSMGATVATLEALGFVSGAPHPKDGRQTVLSLTPACVEMIRVGRAAREDWLFRAIRTNLTAEEQDELASAVALFKRLVDP